MKETIVISVGGSLIVPEAIDTQFLKSFKSLILAQVEKGKNFVLITGGGKTSRLYTDAAKNITTPTLDDLDWIGIASTRLNAELLRVVFGESASEKIIMDPNVVPEMSKSIALGGGWKPGNSSDLAAIQAAISVGAKKVINLSNIDYVYDKDPNKFTDAVKIERTSWADFRKILPETWEPGSSTPFDPVAAEKAESVGIEVVVLNGKNVPNLEKHLNGEDFIGTTIS